MTKKDNHRKKNLSVQISSCDLFTVFSLQIVILDQKSNMEEGTKEVVSESKDELAWLLIKILNKTNHHLDALFDKKSETSIHISYSYHPIK